MFMALLYLHWYVDNKHAYLGFFFFFFFFLFMSDAHHGIFFFFLCQSISRH